MNKNQTIGSVLLVVGAGLGIFFYAHRPPEGLMDVLSRQGSWAFNSQAYYGGLFVAALFIVAGIVRMIGKSKDTSEAPKS